jgi:outer membrane protein OmpA-like peptidoglycan-associated protein/tetratricopeptide (TPR) repeat protein
MSNFYQINQPLYLKLFLFVILFFSQLVAIYSQKQSDDYKKAESYYKEQKYEKAIKYYQIILETNPDYSEVLVKIARCYEKMGQYQHADENYAQLFIRSEKVDPALFLEYGELQLKMGRPEKARGYFISYNNLMESNDLRVIQYLYSIENSDQFYYDSSFYSIKKLKINSQAEDFNPIFFNKTFFFESNRENIEKMPLLNNIFYSSIKFEKNDTIYTLLDKINEKCKGNGFTIVPITNEIIQSKILYQSTDSIYSLYRSIIQNDNKIIKTDEKIRVDSFYNNAFFPTVSPNGDRLVFASDAIQGVGGLDLYFCNKTDYGYSTPHLIPGFVNTLGDESFPFLLNDSVLFFSSNGQGGLGGFDIFYINLNKPTSLPVNLGYPINSRFDETGISISIENRTGYVTSNRSGSSLSDIYEFHILKTRALGVITDDYTGENLKNVEVEIKKSDESVSYLTLADNGHFSITGIPGEIYNLTIRKNGYKTRKFDISSKVNSIIGLNEIDIGVFKIEKDTIISTQEISLKNEPITKDENVLTVNTKVVRTEATIPLIHEKDTLYTNNNTLQEDDNINNIKFRVQIAAGRKQISNDELRKIYKGNNGIYMYTEENWHKYSIGDFNSYFEANTLRKQCGVKNAFIAAYSGRKKYELMSAIKVINCKSLQDESGLIKLSDKRQIVFEEVIYYALDNYLPINDGLSKLEKIKETLESDSLLRIEIDGHTDKLGSTDYNIGLSTERAKFIKEYLIKNNIDPGRIFVLGYGKSRLKKECYNNCSSEIHRENRRVEIILFR